jgi:tetratricopeptide (TPR) repeat protein
MNGLSAAASANPSPAEKLNFVPRYNMKKKDALFILILIIIVFGLYWKTFSYELIWDTKILIQQNLLFKENPPLWSALKFGYFREQCGMGKVDFYYRPLVTASFLLENKLWGLKNTTLRLTNLLLYLLSLVVLYLFFKNQNQKNNFPEIATILFALYPLNVDNIVWVVSRGDLLLLLWGSLTLLFLELHIRKGKPVFLICSSLFYLLGIFSKEAFLFFFPILVLYERIKRKKLSLPYHLVNFLITIFFFILKNGILGIKNLKLVILPSFWANIKVVLATMGFYLRSLVFPLYYDTFLSQKNVVKWPYIILGIISTLVFLYFIHGYKKEKWITLPLSFILAFMGGHAILVFSSLFPFKVYSRYMMIPALGLVWILTKYLCQTKEKIRLYTVLILILLFIPSIIINAQSYRNEQTYFERALRSSPTDAYLLYSLAFYYFDDKEDLLRAESILDEALSYKMRRQTAILVYLLYSDIEFAKSDYRRVFTWLEQIKDFQQPPHIQLAPFIRYSIHRKEALVNISLGNVSQAEKLLIKNMEEYGNLYEPYMELYNMYIGYNLWDKAKQLEVIMKEKFPSFFINLNTKEIKKRFDSFTPDQKIGFFTRFKNFQDAIDLIKNRPHLDLSSQLFLSKLLYRQGKEKEGEKLILDILDENPDDYRILNAIGDLYLRELFRVKKALIYFQESLEMNENQPEIADLVKNLEKKAS